MGAADAVEVGLADKVVAGTRPEFERTVLEYAERLAVDPNYERLLAAKRAAREADERRKPLDAYRVEELAEMSRDMFDDRCGFRAAREGFVLKRKAEATPEHLAVHRELSGASSGVERETHLICEIGCRLVADDYLVRIGRLIRDARQHRGWTQLQLAEALATSQSAVNRIERGNQNISLEMIARIGEALDSEIVSLGYAGPMHLRVVGGRRLSGSIDVKTSKNACVALLCASLLNAGRTMLRRVARIEEVYRILEVLDSIGVRGPLDQRRQRPGDRAAGRAGPGRDGHRGRPPHPQRHHVPRPADAPHRQFRLPYAGGCDLGTRTVAAAHDPRCGRFGLDITATGGIYHARGRPRAYRPGRPIVLTERGDTVTENALLAAARHDGVTVIRNASSNYMVQDLCFFLEAARRAGGGHRHHHADRPRRAVHRRDVDYSPSEDPVEAMSLLAAAVVTSSELTIRRVPIEFLEIELAVLEEMGLDHDRSAGVPGRQRPHPAGRPDRPALEAATPRSTRSTRCRSPA